jgi:hypothetical protein
MTTKSTKAVANTEAKQNVIIKDVELRWAKLNNPVSPFGTLQWELQVVADKSRTKELEQFGKVKATTDGKVSVNLKKKALKADGSPAEPVRLVDAKKEAIQDRSIVGNGSKGNVMVFLRPYEMMGKKGTSVMLVAVQVTDLQEYRATSGVDFDMLDSDESNVSAKAPTETEESPF